MALPSCWGAAVCTSRVFLAQGEQRTAAPWPDCTAAPAATLAEEKSKVRCLFPYQLPGQHICTFQVTFPKLSPTSGSSSIETGVHFVLTFIYVCTGAAVLRALGRF